MTRVLLDAAVEEPIQIASAGDWGVARRMNSHASRWNSREESSGTFHHLLQEKKRNNTWARDVNSDRNEGCLRDARVTLNIRTLWLAAGLLQTCRFNGTNNTQEMRRLAVHSQDPRTREQRELFLKDSDSTELRHNTSRVPDRDGSGEHLTTAI